MAHGHPWIYRDALEPFAASPGSVVTVVDRRGRFLARGLAEAGPIGVRVFTLRDEPLDAELMVDRIELALALRDELAPADTDALRLLHGEGDRVPGAVCDRYGAHAVLRLDGKAIETWSSILLEALRPRLERRGVDALLLKSGRGKDKRVELQWGEAPPERLVVRERGMKLIADLVAGQKTGMFLDHRPSRWRVRQLARDRRVLNLYAYNGGFSIAAGLGGAREVTTIDVAPGAIALAESGWEANGLDPALHHAEAVEVEPFLERILGQGRQYELVISDPPSFAPSEAARAGALKAYKALHRACIRAVIPGGLLLAASCSSHVGRADFETTLREAAHGARRRLQVLERSGAGVDHPVPLGFPEGDYLTVVLARVVD